MHIVIADQLPASAVELLSSRAGMDRRRQSRTHARRAGAAISPTPTRSIVRSATKVAATLLAAAPKLRVIARAGTGVDNVDLAAASARGILVMNAPGATASASPSTRSALMLSLARSVPAADAAMKRGVWDKKKLTGAELRGKTLGLVGLGRIGQEVAARARAFGMEIVAHDPFISEQVADALGIELLTLDAHVRGGRLHQPPHSGDGRKRGTCSTRRALAKCKKGVRIVNTARGELIDDAALADAIESGHVAGAALDVFEIEPPTDWRLAQLPQVVATPHIAASTAEARNWSASRPPRPVRDYLTDGVIRNAVNFPAIARRGRCCSLRPYLALAEQLGALGRAARRRTTEGHQHPPTTVRSIGPTASSS